MLLTGRTEGALTFVHDEAFTHTHSQLQVYDSIGALLVHNFLIGYNCAFLAYGQPGSGKTYTLIGETMEEGAHSKDQAGLLPRAASELFAKLQARARLRAQIVFTALGA